MATQTEIATLSNYDTLVSSQNAATCTMFVLGALNSFAKLDINGKEDLQQDVGSINTIMDDFDSGLNNLTNNFEEMTSKLLIDKQQIESEIEVLNRQFHDAAQELNGLGQTLQQRNAHLAERQRLLQASESLLAEAEHSVHRTERRRKRCII